MGLFGDLLGAVAKGMANGLVKEINKELNKDPITLFAEHMKYTESKYNSYGNEKLIDIAYNAKDPFDRDIACNVLNSRGYVMTSWKVKISGDFSIGPGIAKEVEVGEFNRVKENDTSYKLMAHNKAKAIEIVNEKIMSKIATARPELKNFRIASIINTEWIASVRGYAKNSPEHSDVFDFRIIKDNEDEARSGVISRAERRHKKYENFKIESIHRVIEE